MADVDETEMEVLDRALMAMRRFIQVPRTVPDGDQRVELSTLLVLDAVDRTPDSSIREVADHLHVTHSTASRLVQRAVDAGAIARTSGRDSRRAALTPTAAGSALQERAKAYRHAQLRRRVRGWTATEISAFAQALQRFAVGE